MKAHINYYQVFIEKLKETNDTIHTTNNMISSIILLVGEVNFNEWYAGIIEECSTYSKLEFKDLFETSTDILHDSLRIRKCFVDDTVCTYYDSTGVKEKPRSEVYENIMYHALTFGSSFWVIHQLIIEYHFQN